jgi:hypothetical protein
LNGQALRKNTQYCKGCNPGFSGRSHRIGGRLKRPFEGRYNAWTRIARNHGHIVEITYEEYHSLVEGKPSCHYCGAEIQWLPHGHSKAESNNSSGLDRKDSYKGYTVDNVVICCARCNWSKSNRFTYEEWKQIGALISSWGASESIPDGTGNSHDLDGRSFESGGDRDSPKDAFTGPTEPQCYSSISKGTHPLVRPKGPSEDHPLPRRSPLTSNWSR